jgi:insulysin
MNAVNSENEKNQQSDFWRFYQLLYKCAQPKSAFNKFIIGNKQTLDKDDIRDQLLDFYDKWYSANTMKLCVYSNKELDDIEKIVVDKFSSIENKQIQIPNFNSPKNYPKSFLGKLIHMKS